MNVIDRLVGWLDPSAGLRRYHQRRMLTRAYEAASPRDAWRPRRQGASANADHAADAATLRAKARALVQNVPYMRAGLDGLVAYTIGTGIVSRSIGRNAEAFNAAFAAWARVCDADGRLDWPGLQAAAYRAMEQDGEVLVRLRPRRPTDGLPIPLQLQLLEIDWLDTTRSGMVDGAEVVNGIEYDFLGRVAAYWLWDQHPGDMSIGRAARRTSRRVPAGSIIHLYAPERPGQGRGFTRFAPVISRVRDLQLYEDAELARKNLETRLAVLASGDASQLGDPDPSADQPASQTGDLGDLAGGSIVALPPGMTTTVIEPKVAPGYVEYVRHQLHVIAAGLGVPYELMIGDVSQTNYSSARVRLLDFRRTVGATQWNLVIPRLIERVCIAAEDAAALAGVVQRADHRFDHSTPKWDYVNPEQDVKSDMLEIASGLTSWSEKLRQRGYNNPAEVLQEISADFASMRQAGVLDVLLSLQGKQTEADAAARNQPATRDLVPAAAPAAPAQPLPAGFTQDDGSRLVQIRLDPPVIHYNPPPLPPINVEAPIVHVAPPQVRVEAPVVNVQPPEVRVDFKPPDVHVAAPVVNVPAPVVNINTPRRRIDGLVERDQAGRVLRTTQIETDIDETPAAASA